MLGTKDSLLSESSTSGTNQKRVQGDEDNSPIVCPFPNLSPPNSDEDDDERVKPVAHVKTSTTETGKPSEPTMRMFKREAEFLTSTQCSGLADDTMLNTPTGTNVEFARLFGGPQRKPQDAVENEEASAKIVTANDDGMSKDYLLHKNKVEDYFTDLFSRVAWDTFF